MRGAHAKTSAPQAEPHAPSTRHPIGILVRLGQPLQLSGRRPPAGAGCCARRGGGLAAPHRADAAQPAVGQALRARIHQAEARGLFGAPSFWVAGELFWGNDRLEEAVEWAVRR